LQGLTSPNSIGIVAGLGLGKPIGVSIFCFLAVTLGLCRLPSDLTWRHLIGAGMLGGIGFTMSIFITNLAFPQQEQLINASKMAILAASLGAGLLGFVWLRLISTSTEK
jgi:NhaA family Na+:H+ antiporter